MHNLKFLFICFCFSAFTASAQVLNDGSVYSRYGLGDNNYFTHSQASAMGGNGVALSSSNYISLENPASLANQVLTRFSAGFLFSGSRLTDASGNVNNLTTGGMNGLQFGFPLKVNKVGVGISYRPYTQVGYRIVEAGEVPAFGEESPLKYNVSYEGGGGLQQFEVGTGARVKGKNFKIGGALRLYSGTIENLQRTTFDSTAFNESRLNETTKLFGLAGHFGIHYETALKEGKYLAVGATFTTPTALTTRRVSVLGEGQGADSLGVVSSGKTTLPMMLNVGISYRPDDKWLFLTDVRYEPWSAFESDFAFGGYDPSNQNRKFRNKVRISGGFEFKPGGNNRGVAYNQRISYRFGLYRDEAYFQPIQGVNFSTVGVTGGLSFPTKNIGTQMDLNFEIGKRGTTDNNLVQDLFYKTTVTINFGELWFIRRKLR